MSDIVVSNFQDRIFNIHKSDYATNQNVFLGESPGLFDTIHQPNPEFLQIFQEMRRLDWEEFEFNFGSCRAEFETCDRNTYDIMIETVASQWEADSTASRAITPIVAPFITNDMAWRAWSRITENEALHAATYSEIVKFGFAKPEEALVDITLKQEAHLRIAIVSETLARIYEYSHEYALGRRENNQDTYNWAFMFAVTMLLLERIQFMCSFAVTFTIGNTGQFMPIAKAVQKIAQDELEVHVRMDKAVIQNEMRTSRGQLAYKQMRPLITQMTHDIVRHEEQWANYLFSNGRQLPGVTVDILKAWNMFNAKDVFHFLKLDTALKLPSRNPMPHMERWLDISKTQVSQQEERNGQYKMNIVRRDDEDEVFDL